VRSRRNADSVAVRLRAAGPIVAGTVEGQLLPRTAAMDHGELKLPYVGVPRDGITLAVTLRGHGTARVSVRDYSQGLPAALDTPGRPADTMPAALSFRADPTVVISNAALRY
jgi:hypothetical protein